MAKNTQSARRNMPAKMSIRKGDEVVVIAGKDRGKHGKVELVYDDTNRVVVEGINMVKRHLRRQPGSLQAGIIDKPGALHRSNIMIVCPSCGQPTRAGRTVLPDGSSARTCKKCGELLNKEQ